MGQRPQPQPLSTPSMGAPAAPANDAQPPAGPPQDALPGVTSDPWGTGGMAPTAPEPPPATGKQGSLELPKTQPPTVAGELKFQRADMIAAADVRANMPGAVV